MHDILPLTPPQKKGTCSESRDLFTFWEISNISETVQDRNIVAMED